MRIGLIVAMEAELEMVREQLGATRPERANGYEFYRGRMGDNEIIAVRGGIGKVNAAVAALTLIERFAPLDAVVNSGVAGGLGHTHPGDVVVATEVGYHDVWCGDGLEPGQVQGQPVRFACHGLGLLGSPGRVTLPARVVEGFLASGDRFITSPGEVADILAKHPDAVAVDMESAAIAQVCLLKGVPFACVRVVSDTPGVDDHFGQYLDFWTAAPRESFAVLRPMLAATKTED